ncbi:PTS sugar transporter subunit IIA [Enterococcus alcedinis]|uniref:PTS fructose transporter subunit IIA n=1 Tax=Enterococcus alcedinis TaxID=1274384 RepID=A0A917JI88_9ENTE|nr:PTS fructose transporter subunit IIA [Enterococcus alcedinis]MBP2102922.1 PTS system mannose-specific IIA component [Enterococcus alcedinis]GGI66417.1 PTS fructose transporter subunit IIA [Enterococcus alcedinis]
MSHLVLISHGTFCEHLKQSTEMIMGPQETIHTVALLPEEGPAEFQTKLQAVLDNLDDYVVLCDLAGGTPSNVAAKMLMTGASFELYSGMNMPMVISFINGEMIGSKANLVADAREGITFINDLLAAVDDDEDE